MSVKWVSGNSLFPLAVTVSFTSLASITIVSFALSFLKASLNCGFRSARLFFAAMAIMQSPRFVRCVSFVISNVVLFVDRMFS